MSWNGIFSDHSSSSLNLFLSSSSFSMLLKIFCMALTTVARGPRVIIQWIANFDTMKAAHTIEKYSAAASVAHQTSFGVSQLRIKLKLLGTRVVRFSSVLKVDVDYRQRKVFSHCVWLRKERIWEFPSKLVDVWKQKGGEVFLLFGNKSWMSVDFTHKQQQEGDERKSQNGRHVENSKKVLSWNRRELKRMQISREYPRHSWQKTTIMDEFEWKSFLHRNSFNLLRFPTWDVCCCCCYCYVCDDT